MSLLQRYNDYYDTNYCCLQSVLHSCPNDHCDHLIHRYFLSQSLATLHVILPHLARLYYSWPQTLPQDSTGSEEQMMRLNKCTVTWKGAAMVWVEAG